MGHSKIETTKNIYDGLPGKIGRQLLDSVNVGRIRQSSQVSILDTRGKRVTAEVAVPAELVREVMRTTPEQLFRECLELLGCYGVGEVRKLAEIVAATALCGELSLGSAIVAGEWVGAHERLGRNRLALRGFNSEKEASWTG
jgi:hydroxymethylglutaryl-CoA reductase